MKHLLQLKDSSNFNLNRFNRLSISSKLQSRKISPEKALIFDFYKDTKLMSKLANDFSIEMPNFKSRKCLFICR